MLNAELAWEISEIIIGNHGNTYILYDDPADKDQFTHGVSQEGSIGLSLAEAKELVKSITSAIEAYEACDKALEELKALPPLTEEEMNF